MDLFQAAGDFISFLITSPIICCGWLIVGAIAGGVAQNLMGGGTRTNLIGNVALGLVGAVVGGFIVGALGLARPDGGLPAVIVSLLVAILGAVVLIAIGRVLRGRPIRS
ncbi:MAG: GlsB/YeaQ/YmgE family stress response membrane protein [Anaerolinea sp.]|nr:GlsB/YeaQ/YmgE family stress response membrane protein [Anaerolinea sp.]